MAAPSIDLINQGFFTTTKAAWWLDIKRPQLLRWIRQGKVPPPVKKLKNGTMYFDRKWVFEAQKWIRTVERKGKRGPPLRKLKESLLTLSQVASIAGKSRKTIIRWIKRGWLLPCTRRDMNGVMYFSQEWLEKAKPKFSLRPGIDFPL